MKNDKGYSFNLYRVQRRLEQPRNFNVYRYIFRIIVAGKKSIAFLTINDPFLLMDNGETPFKEDEDKKLLSLGDVCALDCVQIGYVSLKVGEKRKINYCCEVNKKLLDFVSVNEKFQQPDINLEEMQILRMDEE